MAKLLLEKDIRVRVTKATKLRIEEIVAARGEGVLESDIIREAIAAYLESLDGTKVLSRRPGSTPPKK